MLLMAALMDASDSVTGVAIDNPLVLGPIAAFIFAIFVSETVVSGKAYKREVAENARLRETVERVVPLAEKMVTATEQILEVTSLATQALRDLSHRHDRDW